MPTNAGSSLGLILRHESLEKIQKRHWRGFPAVSREMVRDIARDFTNINLLIVFIAVVMVITSLGCIITTGSKNLVTAERSFTDFTAIDAENGFHVYVIPGSEYRITITTDDNVMERVTVSKSGKTLFIGLKPGSYEDLTLRANITMPELEEADFSGGSHLTGEGFNVTEMTLILGGGSHATMAGSVADLTATADGGSHLKLKNFQIQDADITLRGGSWATISIEGTLDASLTGGSHLNYYGNPTMGDIQTSGGSHITRK
jgi:hypothetical protein